MTAMNPTTPTTRKTSTTSTNHTTLTDEDPSSSSLPSSSTSPTSYMSYLPGISKIPSIPSIGRFSVSSWLSTPEGPTPSTSTSSELSVPIESPRTPTTPTLPLRADATPRPSPRSTKGKERESPPFLCQDKDDDQVDDAHTDCNVMLDDSPTLPEWRPLPSSDDDTESIVTPLTTFFPLPPPRNPSYRKPKPPDKAHSWSHERAVHFLISASGGDLTDSSEQDEVEELNSSIHEADTLSSFSSDPSNSLCLFNKPPSKLHIPMRSSSRPLYSLPPARSSSMVTLSGPHLPPRRKSSLAPSAQAR